MKSLLTTVFVCLAMSAFSSSQPYFVIAKEESKSVSVGLMRKADYVAMTVSLSSDHRDSQVRNEELSRAKQLLVQEAQKNGKITAKPGAPVLSSRDTSALKINSYGDSDSRTTVVLYHPLGTNSIYGASRDLKRFVKNLRLTDRLSVSLSPNWLAVESPEKYRNQILEKLYEEVARTTNVLKVNQVSISGMERPVIVRQMDEENVELYIDYKLSVEAR